MWQKCSSYQAKAYSRWIFTVSIVFTLICINLIWPHQDDVSESRSRQIYSMKNSHFRWHSIKTLFRRGFWKPLFCECLGNLPESTRKVPNTSSAYGYTTPNWSENCRVNAETERVIKKRVRGASAIIYRRYAIPTRRNAKEGKVPLTTKLEQ